VFFFEKKNQKTSVRFVFVSSRRGQVVGGGLYEALWRRPAEAGPDERIGGLSVKISPFAPKNVSKGCGLIHAVLTSPIGDTAPKRAKFFLLLFVHKKKNLKP